LSYSARLPLRHFSAQAVARERKKYFNTKGYTPMFEHAFDGKVVVVTGGSRGIGFAAVKKFLGAGAKVCFLSHYEETGKKALEQLLAENPAYEVMNECIDLCDFKAAQELYEKVAAKWGRIDVLVNNAGMDSHAPIVKMKQSEWNTVMDTNLKSIFNMSKYAVKYIKKYHGCIVNTASVAGVFGSGMGCPYPASKAGVIGLTKSLAWEFAGVGVRVNAVAPGVVDTDMVAALPKIARDTINHTIPLTRFGQPEDIANGMVFLASDAASYITGVTLQIDGGYIPSNTLA
jgi:NAD(P)-dependent dehydrogenase (short-subunit alcohol dehydrogenase family)